jgi:squalene-hopene/tetraprenyl-beta-curcumene cyclase
MVRGTVSTGKMPDSFAAAPAPVALHTAIERTSEWLLERQAPQGYWCAELEGDTILESEYILLLAWLGREDSDIARKAAEYIRRKQLPTGGWSQYPGG